MSAIKPPNALPTDRLVLRPQRADDAAAYREMWTERDPRVPPHRRIGADGRPSVEDVAAGIRAEADSAQSAIFTITRTREDDVIGYCGLRFDGRGSFEEPELVYELLRRAHGAGYATEAARAVVAWATAAGCPRLWAGVRDWNAASLNVLHKLGFVHSGEVEPHPVFGDSIIMTRTLPTERAVRDLVYATFAQEGRAPSVAELARRTDSTVPDAHRALHALADAHQLVLTPDGDAVRMAHPFSAAPMAFVVTPLDGRDDRRWWGGCAWDSFGISAALRLDVRVDTACPQCGRAVRLTTGPTTPPPEGPAVRFPKPAAQWWDDVVATCTAIRLFCDPAHANGWSAEHAPGTGYVTDARTVWELAHGWYGDRLAPGFRPHTREHNQRLLTEVGLVGDFWRLP